MLIFGELFKTQSYQNTPKRTKLHHIWVQYPHFKYKRHIFIDF